MKASGSDDASDFLSPSPLSLYSLSPSFPISLSLPLFPSLLPFLLSLSLPPFSLFITLLSLSLSLFPSFSFIYTIFVF